MKRFVSSVIFVIIAAFSASAYATTDMSDYCSAPPYVTRTVPPNIMILMDNSQNMTEKAYSQPYVPYDATHSYEGYFRSDLMYSYSSNAFVPDATGKLSGNLLNWATMSRYDLLQKILVGGMSASRQSNINTLRSDSGSWTKTYHPTLATGCIFKVDGGYVSISDDPDLGTGSCPYLRTPPELLASSRIGVKIYDAYSDSRLSLVAILHRLLDVADRAGVFIADAFDHLTSSAFAAKPLSILTKNIADAVQGAAYIMTISATGGTGTTYTWSISSGALPAGLTLDTASTSDSVTITGTTSVPTGSYSFTVLVTNNAGQTATKSYTITVAGPTYHVSPNYKVWVCAGDYAVNCNSGNACQSENDTGCVMLKSGIVDDFWNMARFGLQDFSQQASNINPDNESCIPASPKTSFLTNIENATAVGDAANFTPLVDGVYTAVDYYQNNTANNCDPFLGTYRCTKNFILMITAGEGANLGTNTFSDATHCGSYTSNNLAKNTCYGFSNDLRPAADGKQNVMTYVVNTNVNVAGTSSAILSEAAAAGGGKYYSSPDGTDLRKKLLDAFTDILSKAASGTAVSVLTTSSRGTGSMVQAYFLPSKQDGTRTVNWTGFLQNIWIDPQDNLREDSTNDLKLITDSAARADGDKVMKLYFDADASETKAALFTTNDDGSGGSLAACSSTDIKSFSSINYLWEAGKKLADIAPADRTLYTSKKVYYGTGTPLVNDSQTDFLAFTTADTTRTAALNADAAAPYTFDNIKSYIKGDCLETVGGGASCTTTVNPLFRDRRLTMPDGTLKVWKLGDIISSTPKVFADTPQNTYHIDYGDSTYYSYVSSADSTDPLHNYRQKSSIAFVGSNDGMLHAFRVGYLKTTGLDSYVKALFKKLFSNDDATPETGTLGEEVWGFVPFNAFPYLKYLADPDYCHVYYNDLSVRLVDATVGGPSADMATFPGVGRNVNSWRTILVGGMRFGGAPAGGTPHVTGSATDRLNGGYSAYYALDITDPEHPVPLWEFSDPDLGYSTTYPAIIRTGATGVNGKWYVAVGSGSTKLPKSSVDIERTSTGYLYLLDLKTGQLVKKISLGDNAMVGDILAIDKDKDYVSEKLYFGTAYNTSGHWQGKLMSLYISPSSIDNVLNLCGNTDVDEPSSCGALQTLFAPRTSGSPLDYFPITASPDAVKDAAGNTWVYAGSGKYNSDVDEADSDTKGIFFGLIDSGTTHYLNNLDNTTDTPTTGDVTKTTTVCAYDSSAKSFGQQTVVTEITPTSATPSASAIGWYVRLSTKERVITRPLAVGGIVDFLTYTPSSDLCSYGGSSSLYALGYTNGVAPSNVAIRGLGATSATSGAVTVYKGISLGPGAPPTGEGIIITPPKAGQESLKKKIQVATGVIVEAENQPVNSVISKIVHWLRK